jgi:hypothetical protein
MSRKTPRPIPQRCRRGDGIDPDGDRSRPKPARLPLRRHKPRWLPARVRNLGGMSIAALSRNLVSAELKMPRAA